MSIRTEVRTILDGIPRGQEFDTCDILARICEADPRRSASSARPKVWSVLNDLLEEGDLVLVRKRRGREGSNIWRRGAA